MFNGFQADNGNVKLKEKSALLDILEGLSQGQWTAHAQSQ